MTSIYDHQKVLRLAKYSGTDDEISPTSTKLFSQASVSRFRFWIIWIVEGESVNDEHPKSSDESHFFEENKVGVSKKNEESLSPSPSNHSHLSSNMTKIHPDPALSGGENGLNKVREFIAASSTQGGGWDDSWKGGATPWDAGSPQPALTSTLQDPETSKLIPTKGGGLVAGCGRGYDVLCLADRGLEVVGADISETAVQKAREVSH